MLNFCFGILLFMLCLSRTDSFVQNLPKVSTIPLKSSLTDETPRTQPIGQRLLQLVLQSPLWKYVLVPQARQKIVDTAYENGIPWNECKDWLASQPGPWQDDQTMEALNDVPDYYQQAFHAYEQGNLCWGAALEVELASAAVGARNFPQYGRGGEDAFRNAFAAALQQGGAVGRGIVVDLGCGTGMSTRRLAKAYPEATSIEGIDLSPYFIQVGQHLQQQAPLLPRSEGGSWISAVDVDDRISYRVGNAESTDYTDNSVDVVNLQFVAHELPAAVTLQVLQEAHRILKPGGQLWFCEMDFETPGYAKQRSNPLLFSLIRSTEPYLDDYAEAAPVIRKTLQDLFVQTVITPATGRHFAIVATKGSEGSEPEHELFDNRFDDQGIYKVEDTHLKTFDNKL